MNDMNNYHNIVWNPEEIEKKSLNIIEESITPYSYNKLQKEVVKRIAHTTGDLQLIPFIKFSKRACENGLQAVKNGADIFCDVNMLAAGISKKGLQNYGGEVHCDIAAEAVKEKAKTTGKTRASTAINNWGNRLEGNIVAIGNAPTALFELLKICRENSIRPALVIGTPVGFVGAAESKEELLASDLPYVTLPGTRGGSSIAAAAVNSLLYFKED